MNQFLKKHLISICILFVAFFTLLALFIYARPKEKGDDGVRESYTRYEKAKILSITDSNIYEEPLYENAPVGSQELTVKILSGNQKGETFHAKNFVGSIYGTKLKEGDPVIVAIYYTNDAVKTVNVYEYNRSGVILFLFAIFVLITILVGGKKGALSLLGLVLSVVSLIFILLPLLYKGWHTLPATLLICVIISIISYVLLEGVTKKTITAMLGTTIGLILSIGFGLLAQHLIKVDGLKMGDYIDALLQLRQGGSPLQLRGLLIAGMMIASLGAIMDVAMSIASSIQELLVVNPNLTRKEIIKSGMNIGHDMIGTMTNTLILAFVGSSFVLVMYIYSLEVPLYELLSSTLVATQVIHSLASSIGVVLSVPITVFISALIYTKKTL